MKRLTLAIGFALLCAVPAYAQDTTVIVKDPDPATPAIQQTTTTTTTEHSETVTPAHTSGSTVHHTVQQHPVHHPAVATHRPATTHESTDTQTVTQTTVTVPPHDSTTVVSENEDGSVTVTTPDPAVELEPADQDDRQH